MSTMIHTWGSTPAERAATFPCDRYLTDADDALFRAVDVAAPVPVVFRWLCQLRVAPYSYDWIDNLGRRSPTTLTPGLERLEIGQRFMTFFRLIEFAQDVHLTARTFRGAVLGQVAATYAVAASDTGTRLLVKVLAWYPPAVRAVACPLLAVGDFVMMRKQLLTLKAYAERSARETAPGRKDCPRAAPVAP